MRKIKRLNMALAALMMTTVMTFPAMASVEEIDSVSLSITSEIYAGYDDSYVEVDVDTEGCTIDEDEVTFTNEPSSGEWDEGDVPKLKVVVRVEDDDEYKFATGIDEDDIDIDGDGEVTSVSRSSRKLTIKITLPEVEYDEDYYEDVEDLDMEDVEWDEDDGIGYWDRNDEANRYEVRLYRDDEAITDIEKTTSRKYDFSEYFTKKGTYTFKVRAVRSSSEKGRWFESDEWYVSASEAKDIRGNSSSSTSSSSSGSSTSSNSGGPGESPTEGAWLRDSVGWWWCNPDKTYPVSAWKKINGLWYYFDSVGYCVQNRWVKTNDIWYYCGPDGDMWYNRWTPDGYWVNANGVWVP